MAAIHATGRVSRLGRARRAFIRRPRAHPPVASPASSSKTWFTNQGVEKDMNVIQQLEKEQQKEKVPAKVVEGTRERIQVFEGTAIRVTGGGLRQNFTVRRVTHGVGVERTFMIHSPRIDK